MNNSSESPKLAVDKPVENGKHVEGAKPAAEIDKPIDASLLTVSPSPHMRSGLNSRIIMGIVLIALLPCVIAGSFIFGTRTVTIVLFTVLCAVLAELLYELILKKPITIGDLSAAVTGVILALNLPITIPLWAAGIGAVFAIVVTKMLFGGIGKNFANPACAGRIFVALSFAEAMRSLAFPYGTAVPAVSGLLGPVTNGDTFIRLPFWNLSGKIESGVDLVAGATAMTSLKDGSVPSGLSVMDMLSGNMGGVIGEVCVWAILIGLVILLATKVISWHIPAGFVGTVALLTFALPRAGITLPVADRAEFMLYELLAGGLLFGAVFMATDYSTSPVTKRGRLIFGIGCGVLTVFGRYFTGYPEWVSFSILIMNCLVWFIDRVTIPKKFGYVKPPKKVKEGKTA